MAKIWQRGFGLLVHIFFVKFVAAFATLSAMPKNNFPIDTTGLPELDAVLGGLLAGDTMVWNVEHIADYQRVVSPFVAAARRDGRKLVYFRCARHDALVGAGDAEEVVLPPEMGFEEFLQMVHQTIAYSGTGAYFLFDCLSDLAADWYSNAMLGNFFVLTSPRIRKFDGVACFGLFRGHHSRHALEPIRQSTSLFLEAFQAFDRFFVLPVRTEARHSAFVHLLHEWLPDGRFDVVHSSALIAQVTGPAAFRADRVRGHAKDITRKAMQFVESPPTQADEMQAAEKLRQQMIRMIITRDASILPLVEKYLTLADIIDVQRRMIGTGLIGGKTVGMLLARRIVEQDVPALIPRLEMHDSFYVGSDVFYSFLVQNDLWEYRQHQHSMETFLDDIDEARERIQRGTFPEHIIRAFERMLDYFGQYPIIVRSSSLLEDNYGNSFAGKYESVFCANQGSPQERIRDFLDAVRTVYASSMSREALSYRAHHGLLKKDEQMALLVMRVTGEIQPGETFYPHVAGVGFSYNPFVWSPEIEADAGVMRLVFGLGTRAVDRVDDDYTRVVALNAPMRRPEGSLDEIVRHSQRKVDYINLKKDRLATGSFSELALNAEHIPLELFTSEDSAVSTADRSVRILTFDRLLSKTPFVEDFRRILSALAAAYGKPVDMEFAANFTMDETDYDIHLLQCRPLHIQGGPQQEYEPDIQVDEKDILLAGKGAVVGHSRVLRLDWILYVAPEKFSALPEQDRHEIARAIGTLNRTLGGRGDTLFVAAPGRWGTHMASLGVPVTFAEMSRISAICELHLMHEHLVPDVSLGTHFFGELVEMNMLYFAVFPGRAGNILREKTILDAPNHLAGLAPDFAKWASVLHVAHADTINPAGLHLIANNRTRTAIVAPLP